MPGMAFDRNGNRIGFGKGYYDYYIQTVNERSYKNGFTKPKTGILKF
jgi:5-formyltetrahydrofolate cyclo-ligase